MPRTSTEPANAAKWDSMYQLLQQYREQHGHVRVPQTLGALGKWVKLQRKKYKQEKMTADRIQRLEATGFLWSVGSSSAGVAVCGKMENTECVFPSSNQGGNAVITPANRGVASQQVSQNTNSFLNSNVSSLQVTFPGLKKDGLWKERYQSLVNVCEFIRSSRSEAMLYDAAEPERQVVEQQMTQKDHESSNKPKDKQFNNTDVSSSFPCIQSDCATTLQLWSTLKEQHSTLYKWLQEQRKKYVQGKLSTACTKLLSQCLQSHIWHYEPAWIKWFAQLRAYQQQFGTVKTLCEAPVEEEEPKHQQTQFSSTQPATVLRGLAKKHRSLHEWVHQQRSFHNLMYLQHMNSTAVAAADALAINPLSHPSIKIEAQLQHPMDTPKQQQPEVLQPLTGPMMDASGNRNIQDQSNHNSHRMGVALGAPTMSSTAAALASPITTASTSNFSLSILTVEQAEWLQSIHGWTWEGDEFDQDDFGKHFLELKRLHLVQQHQSQQQQQQQKQQHQQNDQGDLRINVRKSGALGKFVQLQRKLYQEQCYADGQAEQQEQHLIKPTIESLAAAAETLLEVNDSNNQQKSNPTATNASTENHYADSPPAKRVKTYNPDGNTVDGVSVTENDILSISTTNNDHDHPKRKQGRPKKKAPPRLVLTQRKVEALNSIGFSWTPCNVQHTWEDMFRQLQAYKDKYGDCLVPKRYKENPKLGMWVGKQRDRYKKYQQLQRQQQPKTTPTNNDNDTDTMFVDRNKRYWDNVAALTQEQVDRLNSMGFVWMAGGPKAIESDWQNMYEKLKHYRAEHGTCNVSQKAPGENGKLGRWVKTQRERFFGTKANLTSLTAKQMKQLEEIGFEWRPGGTQTNEETWNAMFEQLKAFRQEHGDCKVPQKKGKLGGWVDRQRKRYRATMQARAFQAQPKNHGVKPPSLVHNTLMTEEQIKLLNSIGFAWQLRERSNNNNNKVPAYIGGASTMDENFAYPGTSRLSHLKHEDADNYPDHVDDMDPQDQYGMYPAPPHVSYAPHADPTQQLHLIVNAPEDEAATRTLLYFQGGGGLSVAAAVGGNSGNNVGADTMMTGPTSQPFEYPQHLTINVSQPSHHHPQLHHQQQSPQHMMHQPRGYAVSCHENNDGTQTFHNPQTDMTSDSGGGGGGGYPPHLLQQHSNAAAVAAATAVDGGYSASPYNGSGPGYHHV